MTLFLSSLTDYVYSQESISPRGSENPNGKTLACLLPLSGEYKSIGKKALMGVLAAAGVFGTDSDFRVVVKDYAMGSEIREALKELAAKDGAAVLIGPVLSSSIKGISESVKSLGIPTVVFPFSQNLSQGNPYLIRFSYSLEKQARVLASYAVGDIKIKTFGILYPKTEIGGLFKEAFIKSVRESGGNIIYLGSYDSSLHDISKEIGWIKLRHPGAIFIPDGATHSADLIIKLRQESGLKDLIFLGPNTWNSQAFIKTLGLETDGIIFTDFFFSVSERWIDFKNKFSAAFNEDPGFLEYQVYEAVNLILGILRTPVQKREEVKERILAIKDDPLFDITENIDKSLEISPKPLVLKLKGRQIIRIK
jgi:ABC-type branched-subunit amino acid transport system substrate-binding protein